MADWVPNRAVRKSYATHRRLSNFKECIKFRLKKCYYSCRICFIWTVNMGGYKNCHRNPCREVWCLFWYFMVATDRVVFCRQQTLKLLAVFGRYVERLLISLIYISWAYSRFLNAHIQQPEIFSRQNKLTFYSNKLVSQNKGLVNKIQDNEI